MSEKNKIISYVRLTGYLEGISFLVLLLIAMPLKYFADMPLAVKYTGWAHGVLFMLYIVVIIYAAMELRWSWRKTAAGLIASVVPAGPFIFDRYVLGRGE